MTWFGTNSGRSTSTNSRHSSTNACLIVRRQSAVRPRLRAERDTDVPTT
jgi:hypothetical protein